MAPLSPIPSSSSRPLFLLARSIPKPLRHGVNVYVLIGCLVGAAGFAVLVAYIVYDQKRLRRRRQARPPPDAESFPEKDVLPPPPKAFIKSSTAWPISSPFHIPLPPSDGRTIRSSFSTVPDLPSRPPSTLSKYSVVSTDDGRPDLVDCSTAESHDFEQDEIDGAYSVSSPSTPVMAKAPSFLRPGTPGPYELAMTDRHDQDTPLEESDVGVPVEGASGTVHQVVEVVGKVVLEYPADVSTWDGVRFRPESEIADVFICFPWDDHALHLRINYHFATVDTIIAIVQEFFHYSQPLKLYVTRLVTAEGLLDDQKLQSHIMCHSQLPRLEFWALPDQYHFDMSPPASLIAARSKTPMPAEDQAEAPQPESPQEEDIADLAQDLPGLRASPTWQVYPGQEKEVVQLVFAPRKTTNPFANYFKGMSTTEIEVYGGFRQRDENGEYAKVTAYDKGLLQQIIQLPL